MCVCTYVCMCVCMYVCMRRPEVFLTLFKMKMFDTSLDRFTNVSLDFNNHKTSKSFGVLHASLNYLARDVLLTFIKRIRPIVIKQSNIWAHTSKDNVFPSKCYLSCLFIKASIKNVTFGLIRKNFTQVIGALDVGSPYYSHKETLQQSCYHGMYTYVYMRADNPSNPSNPSEPSEPSNPDNPSDTSHTSNP